MRKKVSLVVSAIALACCASAAFAQSAGGYPSRPVRLIVPLAPGGNADIVARAVAQQLGELLGQTIVVENRPGASAMVGTQLVAKSPPDGYTLLAIANTFAVVPSLVSNPGYDPLKDFAGISLTCLVPQVLVVNPNLPVRSVKELIALAKARPTQLSFASAGTGGTGHMAAELFSRQAGIKMLHVPYKGNSQAIVDVISGQVTMMFDQVSTSVPHIHAGKLRPLAVTSTKPSPLLPEVPTIAQSGLPGFEDITFNGIVAPAGTSHEILVRLQRAIAKAVSTPELHQRFLERGVELAASASPEEFTQYVKAEFEKKAKLAREANIRIE
ncbi:MAG TPA: tripartite tricarboxylate transporter substrate binding protein [Burkholderiales bacterium]